MPTAAEAFATVRDRGVYVPDADAVVVADLHLGLAASTIPEFPLDEGVAIVDRLRALMDRFDPAELVVAGDVLHAFDRVPLEARTAIESARTAADARGVEFVAVEGNHDAQLAALLGEPPIDAYELADGTVVCHGHESPPTAGSRYVIGHEHPAFEVDGRRWPCFLYGPGRFRGADVLVLPAFHAGLVGTPMNACEDGDALSPLLAECSRFRPVVWDEDDESTVVFPPLRSLSSR